MLQETMRQEEMMTAGSMTQLTRLTARQYNKHFLVKTMSSEGDNTPLPHQKWSTENKQ